MTKYKFDSKKRALLEVLLRKEGLISSPPQIITKRKEGVPIPLSFAQQRLRFLDQLEPGSAIYNIPVALRLAGPLHLSALEQSFNEILRRHEALRTTFGSVDGQPVQLIAPAQTMMLSIRDLRSLPETEREIEARRLATEEAQRPFDLSRGPLVRASLLGLDADDHVLLLTVHHIISDGWSIGVFFRELKELYTSFSSPIDVCERSRGTVRRAPTAARVPELPQLPIQYADFSIWQRQWLQGETLQSQLGYWKQQLKGAPDLLELPTDRPRPAVQTFRGGRHAFTLTRPLSEAITALSRREGVSLFMALLAAFKALLHRYSGQDDIVVGTPIANRNRAETEGLIGFFANTLALRTALSGNPTFRELLHRVREVALGAYAHQELPFEMLVDALDSRRTLSHAPLFQVAFALQNASSESPTLPGLTLGLLDADNQTAKFDLVLAVEEKDRQLAGVFEYNTDLFNASTIERMARHYENLLEQLIRDPEQRVENAPIMTESERNQVVVEWNQTHADYPSDRCFHELFESQAERMPDALAVLSEGEQLSYRQLDLRANQLAHYLQKMGVAPEVLVGISMERTPEMVVAILGVLKAGGAYVPLDPTYPPERLGYMLDDSRVSVLLTQQRLIQDFPAHKAHVICMDADWESIAAESATKPESNVKPENLAYVIYTSGSTGKPKGVLLQHRGVCNLATAQRQLFGLGNRSRVLQFSSLSFDASVWELIMALLSGATLCLSGRDRALSGNASFSQLLTDQTITVATLPPSFLAALTPEDFPNLETIISAGESCSEEIVARWSSGRRFFNAYGPTEVTVCATVALCQDSSQKPAIGRPIMNTQIHLLDRHLEPVPVGVPGEMYIGGAGLARGYLHRPDLTAEKFIPDLFSTEPGRRLYRSGDLARYRADGTIEFLGRIDHQVKLRGFRIELQEIEAVLEQHPGVQQALALTREDAKGTRLLVGYVVPRAGEQIERAELREHVKKHLPEYMVPSSFVMMQALPLTPNGKVDRRALPAPHGPQSESSKAIVEPRTAVESKLAEIWAAVLGVERVGVHDNFFELGGDSIISIQIIARANQAGLLLTPKQLFERQTIAELAAVVGRALVNQAEQDTITGPAPLTPIQHWFFEQNLVDSHHWNQAFLLELQPGFATAFVEAAVQQLIAHHDALRLRFKQEASGWVQEISAPGEVVPITKVDLSEAPEERQRIELEAAAEKMQASLDLSKGPLMRIALFDLGAHKCPRLLVVAHHLLVDHVSWRILLEDLDRACQQQSLGEMVVLPPKTTSYKRWAEQLYGHAQSAELQAELDHWRAAARPRVAPMPVDYPEGRDFNSRGSARTVTVSLSAGETESLLQEVPKVYHSQINDVLLAALAQTFARWTGRRSLLVDLESHGREELFEDVDTSRTVGWFTSCYPIFLKLPLSADSDPGSALGAVKEQLRRVPRRGIGYGLLRHLSANAAVREELRAQTQPELSFNYLGQFKQLLAQSAAFRLADESCGPTLSPRGQRRHLVEINGSVTGSELELTWTYSENVHRRSTIEDLAADYLEALRSLIAHCQSPDAGGYTPSDFPLARLDEHELNHLVTLMG